LLFFSARKGKRTGEGGRRRRRRRRKL